MILPFRTLAEIAILCAGELHGSTPILKRRIQNGQNKMFRPAMTEIIFSLVIVSTLLPVWRTWNGMIDIIDKHSQDELRLTKAQSA
jgi:hypothetical protein